MRKSWVQDVKKELVNRVFDGILHRLRSGETKIPKGAGWVRGCSKSGNPDEIGIYFVDPTASKD